MGILVIFASRQSKQLKIVLLIVEWRQLQAAQASRVTF